MGFHDPFLTGRPETTSREQLLATMEAEFDLPPILKLAFARDPRAYLGWQSMTPLRRRSHLLGIFYYRSPEARARRIRKMLEAALAHAERKPSRKNQPQGVDGPF